MPRRPTTPTLDWSDGAPTAPAFGDVYFSRAGGLAEADTVFLRGCGLPEAWAGRRTCAVGELGFGTGLNALALWRLWRRARPAGATLHLHTVEAAPLTRADAARAHAAFPEIAPLSKRLLAAWPVAASGAQRLWFPNDGFALTVWHGAAAAILAGWRGAFDAWFLDGFAPARNPEMWSAEVFAEIGRLSRQGARLGTYTVAGSVRRGLEAAGFSLRRAPGFGGKRERLEGRFTGPPPARAHNLTPLTARPRTGPIVIVGGGIAGASLAAALARRGVRPRILEAAARPAAGASGNPAGLVMPRLDRGAGPLAEVHLAAYLFALAAYGALGPAAFNPCGVRQRGKDAREAAALADLLADPPLPPALLQGVGDAALHPAAGVVRPAAAIAAWTAGAALETGRAVVRLAPDQGGWRLYGPDGAPLGWAETVVLTAGPSLAHLAQSSWLPLAASRGQIDWAAGPAPPDALTAGAYLAPHGEGALFGATFDPLDDPAAPVAPDAASSVRNWAALARLEPALAERLDRAGGGARAAVRMTTPDRGPVCGLLPDAPAWRARFAGLAQGRAPDLAAPPPALAGLYVLGGLGARGLMTAPFLGEALAGDILGEPSLLTPAQAAAIHPVRFLARSLKRQGKTEQP